MAKEPPPAPSQESRLGRRGGGKNPLASPRGKYRSTCWSRALKKADWRREESKKKTICFSLGRQGERLSERSSGED